MTFDFTLKSYETFLEELLQNDFHFMTLEQYLTTDFSKEHKIVILRNDVDARPKKSLEFAKLEHAMGICGSYYFRAHNGNFEPEIIKEIAALGHEIGYHYEDLRLAKGDHQKAIRSFEQNLSNLRQFYPIKTICMDGQTLSRWNNLDLWNEFNYRKYDIIGEPYLDVDFNKVLYLTDTGRRWNAIRFSQYDKVITKFSYHNKTTFDLIRDFDSGGLPDQIMITTHPQRWHDGALPWLFEYWSQWVKNRIKFVIIKRRS
jgi:hypothetical protein